MDLEVLSSPLKGRFRDICTRRRVGCNCLGFDLEGSAGKKFMGTEGGVHLFNGVPAVRKY